MDSKEQAQKNYADVVNMMNRTRQNRQGGGLFSSLSFGVVVFIVLGLVSGSFAEIVHYLV